MIAIPQGYTLCQTAKALFKAFDRYIDGDEVDCVVVYCGSFILSVSTGLNVRLWVFTVLFVRNVVSVLLESVVVVLGEFVLITSLPVQVNGQTLLGRNHADASYILKTQPPLVKMVAVR